MENASNLAGDNNIVLQNIDGSNINITIQEGLPETVKKLKTELRQKIGDLSARTNKLLGDLRTKKSENQDCSSDEIKKVLRAIKANRCILFIGPEIGLGEEESQYSLHEEKYKAMSEDDFAEVTYNAKDGFFDPHNDPMFEMDMNDYYVEQFPNENKVGSQILYELAQLPFKLIVSTSPDETIRDTFRTYDKEHRFMHFEGAGTRLSDEKPDRDKPLIINLLGSAVSNGGRFIYTEKDFYEYVVDAKIPPEVKKEIQQAAHLLFIGFDLRKWQMRLLLFMLDMHSSESKSNRLLLSHISHAHVEDFLKSQFQVTHINYNYLKFAKELSAMARNHNLAKDLKETFLENQLIKLDKIVLNTSSAEDTESLNQIKVKLNEIETKLGAHVY